MNEGEGTMAQAERESGQRAGYARVTESVTFQAEPWMTAVVRIMARDTRRSAADIYRQAIMGGLGSVTGYTQALAEYEKSERWHGREPVVPVLSHSSV